MGVDLDVIGALGCLAFDKSLFDGLPDCIEDFGDVVVVLG